MTATNCVQIFFLFFFSGVVPPTIKLAKNNIVAVSKLLISHRGKRCMNREEV